MKEEIGSAVVLSGSLLPFFSRDTLSNMLPYVTAKHARAFSLLTSHFLLYSPSLHLVLHYCASVHLLYVSEHITPPTNLFSYFLSQICTSGLPVQKSLSYADAKALSSANGSFTGSFSPAFYEYILLNFIPRCLSYPEYGGSRSLRNDN
jgi:hypothetical protein